MTIDLTGVAVAATGGFFSILGLIVAAWLQKNMKDVQAREVVSAAIKNSLGALQQAATSVIQVQHPQIAGVPNSLAPGVQYVLDHAGDEMNRIGVTPVAVAQKIEAQVGLANLDTNLAISGSASPIVVKPLDPVPEVIPVPPTVVVNQPLQPQ